MKESKKKVLRKIYLWTVKILCVLGMIVGLFMCPMLKLFGYYDDSVSWASTLVPALIIICVQLVWIFGWLTEWIMEEGEK